MLSNKNDEKSETPILMLKNDCHATFKNIVLNSLKEKNSNLSGCIYSGQHKFQKVKYDPRDILEIHCCGLLNSNYVVIENNSIHDIYPEDLIIIQFDDVLEVAQVKIIGELVRIKRQYLGLYGESLPVVVRKATLDDLDIIRKNINDEDRASKVFKESISKFNLEMKLINVHFQFDRKRLFFFYTALGRIDFRELAKDLANVFKTRIELRQIGVRDEAKRIGGLGSCGREYCCLSFLNNFKKITTNLANDHNLASNMGKLSGPCNKLKCCLSFETE